MKVGIFGMGCYIFEKVLINYDFEKMVEIFDEWICIRIGIEERRIVVDDVFLLYMVVVVVK